MDVLSAKCDVTDAGVAGVTSGGAAGLARQTAEGLPRDVSGGLVPLHSGHWTHTAMKFSSNPAPAQPRLRSPHSYSGHRVSDQH